MVGGARRMRQIKVIQCHPLSITSRVKDFEKLHIIKNINYVYNRPDNINVIIQYIISKKNQAKLEQEQKKEDNEENLEKNREKFR